MRLSLRFVMLPILVLGAFAYLIVPFVEKQNQRWAIRDLDIRATLIANTITEPLLERLTAGKKAQIDDSFLRITQDEHLSACWPSTTSNANWTVCVSRLPTSTVSNITMPADGDTHTGRRRPRIAVRDGLAAAINPMEVQDDDT